MGWKLRISEGNHPATHKQIYYDHLFGKELFIWFTASAFRKLLSHVFSYFPFGFEGKMWDLILTVPDHCFYSAPAAFGTSLDQIFVKGLIEHVYKN